MKSLFLIASLSLATFAMAQNQPEQRREMRQERMARMQELKKSMIAERLKLTEQEALKFWPLYDEYSEKMNQQRAERMKNGPAARGFRRDLSDKSEKEIEEIIQAEFQAEEAVIKLKKEYHEKFKKQIGIKRTAELYAAEMDFRRQMMQEVPSRRKRANPMLN